MALQRRLSEQLLPYCRDQPFSMSQTEDPALSRREDAMPEQISKYPDVTLQVLRESGAVCGQGAPQKILKQCPQDRFCSLRAGEVCVYGINEIPQMTQITPQELAGVVCPQAQKTTVYFAGISALEAALVFAVFLSGLGAGKLWSKRQERSGPG
jgi:hypothetical protein